MVQTPLRLPKAKDFRSVWLKPWGCSDDPEGADFDLTSHDQVDFTRQYSIGPGDGIIVYLVGWVEIVGVVEVTSDMKLIENDELRKSPEMKQWPWSVEVKHHTTELSTKTPNGRAWGQSPALSPFGLCKEFRRQFPSFPVAAGGGKSLGAVNFGASALELSGDFAQFLLDRVEAKVASLRQRGLIP